MSLVLFFLDEGEQGNINYRSRKKESCVKRNETRFRSSNSYSFICFSIYVVVLHMLSCIHYWIINPASAVGRWLTNQQRSIGYQWILIWTSRSLSTAVLWPLSFITSSSCFTQTTTMKTMVYSVGLQLCVCDMFICMYKCECERAPVRQTTERTRSAE